MANVKTIQSRDDISRSDKPATAHHKKWAGPRFPGHFDIIIGRGPPRRPLPEWPDQNCAKRVRTGNTPEDLRHDPRAP